MGASKTVGKGIELVDTFLKELNKPAKGAQKVLPAAERAANLEAFLSKSQVREPLYHATPKDIKAFKPGGDDPTLSGRAIWTTTSKTNQPAQHNIGSRKAEFREGVNVMPLHGRAERPLMLDDPGMVDWAQEVFAGGSREFPELLPDQWLKEVKDAGYDSVILADPHGRGDPHEVIFFEPTQLKSAIGNRGTYDINDPDLNMAMGGEVHMGAGGTAKKGIELLEDLLREVNKPVKAVAKAAPVAPTLLPAVPTVQAPTVMIPSRLNELKEAVRKSKGEYGARRVERAADEIPNLEALYNNQALRSAFKGDNAQALMTMNPRNFEHYARPLDERFTDEFSTRHGRNGQQMSYREYMEDYLPNVGGFDDVPFLMINKEEIGLPLTPFLTGHEGRHRNRVLANKGEGAGLVQLLPEGDLRTELPRKSQEEYIEALRKELGLTDNLVYPEKYSEPGESVFDNQIQRPAIKLPDIYAEGGEVHMMGGGRPPRKTTLEEDLKSFKDPALALADMLAGKLRGTTAAATGFYGDIEDLVRKYGKGLPANVIRALLPTREGKETLLPTVEEMDAMLPPVVPEGAGRSKQMADIANTLGMANPLAPTAGAAVVKGAKVAAPIIKAGALDLAASRPAQAAVERLGELTGAGPMYAVKREQHTLHPRGKPLGSEKIRSLAERIAPQTQGEFVRKSKDPKETRSVEDKSLKQFKAEQSMPMVVESNIPIGSPPEFNPIGYEGNVIVGVPGDPTLGGVLSVEELGPTRGTRQLRQVGDVVLDEPVQLYGGPEYGLDNDKAFWASNLTAARGVQNLVNDLGLDRPVLGQYIKMGPGSENFAQHNLDALLSVMQPHNLSREKKDALAEMIRRGYPEGKKGQKTFESFSGFDDPNQVMLESSIDSDLRKWIAESLKMPKNMKPFEMPEGRYVATAITNPELRNLETGVSGFAVGEMRPGSDLLLGPHPSYSHDIPGTLIGRTRHPLPVELAFPDTYQRTTEELVNKPKGTNHFGLFKMSGPRQLIDNQYVDEINEYLNQMKRLTGKKEGGEVHMSTAGAVGKALEKTTPVVDKAIKDIAEGLRGYIDPIATKIADWNWRPLSDVRQDVPLTEIPDYIQKGYGDFMTEQAKRAAAGDLNTRDLIKAYTITRSSVNRAGLPYNTATKTGMKLPRTTEKLIRPEGAFSEWLGSPAGQRYLDDAVLGKFDEKDLEDMVTRFTPFGMPAVLADDMRYAARTLSPKGPTISAEITAPADVYRDTSQQIRGIGPAKSGFMASLLGRGDFPTFDARQVNLHTGQGTKQAKKYMTRGYGEGGEEAVARLADRQRAMNMSIDPALAPFYQHLTHHAVWDALDNSKVTHDDLMRAMRGYAEGGDVKADFFIDPSSYAEAKSKEMYPKKKSEWTERDAARHMLASGMMAQKFGPTAAKMAGLAHEHFNAPVKTLGYALGLNKMPADYEQDLHNNALGIDLAKRAATQEELERLIKEMTSKSSKTQTVGVPFIGEPKNAARLSDY